MTFFFIHSCIHYFSWLRTHTAYSFIFRISILSIPLSLCLCTHDLPGQIPSPQLSHLVLSPPPPPPLRHRHYEAHSEITPVALRRPRDAPSNGRSRQVARQTEQLPAQSRGKTLNGNGPAMQLQLEATLSA